MTPTGSPTAMERAQTWLDRRIYDGDGDFSRVGNLKSLAAAIDAAVAEAVRPWREAVEGMLSTPLMTRPDTMAQIKAFHAARALLGKETAP